MRCASRRAVRYAFYRADPLSDRHLDPLVIDVAYELLEPGPRGRLVEVVDVNAGGMATERLDLDAPDVLIGAGVAPSEQDPAFHAQMLYAVSMRMLEMCEAALGRPLVWAGGRPLRLVPQAFRMANCFIVLDQMAVFFGSFEPLEGSQTTLPGQLVHTCLSADAVAHEVSHAVIETVHSWTRSPVNTPGDDGLAIIESVADLVALFVRMSEPEVLATALRKGSATPRDLSSMFAIAPQFGLALGGGAGLRSFPRQPDRELLHADEDHLRSEVLSSIIATGFLAGYDQATRGVLALSDYQESSAWVHPDLVRRLSDAAARLAAEMLGSVVGCLDLLPPTKLRFVDAVRAIVTIDRERFGAAHAAVRAAMLDEALKWGALDGLCALDEDSVAHQAIDPAVADALAPVPFAAEALHLTIRATEMRRRWTTETRRDRIPDLTAERQRLADDQADMGRDAQPALERWAGESASALRQAAKRYRLLSINGSLRPDATGSVRGRVAVQFGAGRRSSRPTGGFTAWCDSSGRVIYCVSATPRVPAPTATTRTTIPAEYQDLLTYMDP